MEIVSAMRRALADKVGQDRLAVWFGGGVGMELCGTRLRIAAADTRLSFLRRNLHAELAAAARELGVDMEFVVDNSVTADSAPAVRDQKSEVRDQKSEVRDQKSEVGEQKISTVSLTYDFPP